MECSIGFALTQALRQAITLVPENVWEPALDADGGNRAGGDVTGLTRLPDRLTLPTGMPVGVRRSGPPPCAVTIFEERCRWRYQAFVTTNTTTGQSGFLEARHRAHARVEDRIRHANSSGWPGAISVAGICDHGSWLTAVAIAADLVAWLQQLALSGPLATAEPKAKQWATARPSPTDSRRPTSTSPHPGHLALANRLVNAFARIAAIPMKSRR